jgi:urease subunit gamma/beta
MHLTPKETDRLTIFTVAELARRRRARGLKLNYPEAVGLLCDEMMEAARDGRGYDEVIALGMTLLSADDVMDGVAELADIVQVEPQFDDGTKLVTLRRPIAARPLDVRTAARREEPAVSDAASARPGAIAFADDAITINANRPTRTLQVRNTSAYTIQVTSHMHFAEINPALVFDRALARGYRLDLPAGSAMRWEAGVEHDVRLVRRGVQG